jgi:hypothetical protein
VDWFRRSTASNDIRYPAKFLRGPGPDSFAKAPALIAVQNFVLELFWLGKIISLKKLKI